MGSDDDDDETCAQKFKKCRSTAANYGGSFFAVALAFVAFDAAFHSAPMKDPTGWVKQFNIDVWFGPSPHIYRLLIVLAAAATASFVSEIVCILVFYGAVFRLLKYGSIVKLVIIVLFVLPTCIVSIIFAVSAWKAVKTPEKIDGPLFDSYKAYQRLVNQSENANFTKELGDVLEKMQVEIDFMQEDYKCCGINSVDDWPKLDPGLQFKTNTARAWSKQVPARLQWWTNQYKNETHLPKSCCSAKHSGYCQKSSAFRNSCKTELVELLVRCIICASSLLIGSGLCGIVGSISYYRASIAGIQQQERYNSWLVRTGRHNQPDDD